MNTLDDILMLLYRIDLSTQTAIGLAFRLHAGYQSKECKEAYTNAEKWALKDFKELQSYPESWVEAAKLVQEIRRRKPQNNDFYMPHYIQ